MRLKTFYFMGGPADGKTIKVHCDATIMYYPVEYMEPVPQHYDDNMSPSGSMENVLYVRKQWGCGRTKRVLDFFVHHDLGDDSIEAELRRLGRI